MKNQVYYQVNNYNNHRELHMITEILSNHNKQKIKLKHMMKFNL